MTDKKDQLKSLKEQIMLYEKYIANLNEAQRALSEVLQLLRKNPHIVSEEQLQKWSKALLKSL